MDRPLLRFSSIMVVECSCLILSWLSALSIAEDDVTANSQRPVLNAGAKLLEEKPLKAGNAEQGLALTRDAYFAANADTICRYDTNWYLIQTKEFRIPGVNHLGAIHHHAGVLWAGFLHGPENGKYDPKLDRTIVAKISAKDLTVIQTWDITAELTWIDPVCFDGKYLWVGDLRNLGIHRFRLEGDRLIRNGVLRYPKAMHFSQGIRIVGTKLYSIHTFGEMKGLFEFDLPETLTETVQQPTRKWSIQETKMHLEGFDFLPDKPSQLWHAQGKQVDRYELDGLTP